MTARELFDLCTDNTTDCNEKCPYANKREECKAIVDAIHVLRHPSWHTNQPMFTPKRVDGTPISQRI